MNSSNNNRAVRAAVVAGLVAVPLSLMFAGTASADDAGNGKALAKGHQDVAAPVLGPVAPAPAPFVGPVAIASTTDASTAVALTAPTASSDHSTGTAATVGSVSSPQPASGADSNGTGANDTSATNQYTSTRSGLPSMNGNGDNTTTGKPCAGCVGKADNKNPPGQAPNGTDANNGYECDGNNGVGKTNPAHTGCRPPAPPKPPLPPKPPVPPLPPTPPAPCVEAVGPVLPGTTQHTCTTLGGGTSGGAKQPPTVVTPPVTPPIHGGVPTPGRVTHPRITGRTTTPVTALPFTGVQAGMLLELSGLLMLTGVGLVAGTRRQDA